MTSKLQLSHLETPGGSRLVSVANVAEMNGGFSLRNKLIDGRLDFWYEGVTQTDDGYGSDTMWLNKHSGSTKVHSQGALAPGEIADVPSARYYSRTVVTSVAGANSYVKKIQPIEYVGTLAGKKVTFSFYGRADTNKSVALEYYQNFGSGGAPSSPISVPIGKVNLTTTFQRHTVTFDAPSIVGKTLGTDGNSYANINIWFDAGSAYATPASGLTQQSGTFDITCLQLEEGAIATPFEELPISLSKCLVDRYAQYLSLNGDWSLAYMNGLVATTNPITFPIMRIPPTGSALTPSSFLYRSIAGTTKATPTTATLIVGSHILRLRFDVTATYAAGDFIGASGSYVLLSARLLV